MEAGRTAQGLKRHRPDLPLLEQKELGDITWNLGGGWRKRLIQRKSGKTVANWDPYLFAPCGKKIRSAPDLQRYLEQTGLTVDSMVINLDKLLPKEILQKEAKSAGVEPFADIHFHKRNFTGGYIRKRHRHLKTNADGGGDRLNFNRQQEKYLIRQFNKLSNEPTFDQFAFIAMQLKVDLGKVQHWHRARLKKMLAYREPVDRPPSILDLPEDLLTLNNTIDRFDLPSAEEANEIYLDDAEKDLKMQVAEMHAIKEQFMATKTNLLNSTNKVSNSEGDGLEVSDSHQNTIENSAIES